MGKKEKDCGYWIAVLLAGVVLGTALGFVFAWAWHKRPGALGDIRLLELMTAIGTVGAAIGAFYTAYTALRLAKENEESRRQETFKQAMDYLVRHKSIFEVLPKNLLIYLTMCRLKSEGKSVDKEFEEGVWSKIAEMEETLKGVDDIFLHEVDPRLKISVDKIRGILEKNLYFSPNSKESIREVQRARLLSRKIFNLLNESLNKGDGWRQHLPTDADLYF